jgi:hypothetical protein
MNIVNLLPLSSTRQVADIVYLRKKGRIVRLLLTTLDLWKSRGTGRDVFYIETIPRDPDRQRSIKIVVEGKIHILVHKSLSSQLTKDAPPLPPTPTPPPGQFLTLK